MLLGPILLGLGLGVLAGHVLAGLLIGLGAGLTLNSVLSAVGAKRSPAERWMGRRSGGDG